ncbi:cytochrome c biogenesis protein CcsA [Rickettsiella endosymbiont of Dermanyssus gallinae]|uniref:cytochrome c biogenesis protein CcsA n=1 Tax=Rickettsiella endosymbiont of Dermanyssus gallinae TaxID=2856608 RepID=UPI001C533539|nr:cytochrome c biogenesis protein CcsA [Rickettsiella endosymbiont of Dermanyssus gallinae]
MASGAESIHFFLSTLVLIVLCMAALQALLLASQERMLKAKQTIRFIHYFPPLEVMETYLFLLISIAIILLTLVLVSSLILFYPISLEGVWQKTLLSILAWSVLLMLLIGRSYFGWRGKVAIRWTLIGVGLIGGIYLGAILLMPTL